MTRYIIIRLIAMAFLLGLGWFMGSTFVTLNYLAHQLETFWAIPVYIASWWAALVTAVFCGSSVGVWFMKELN